MTGEGRFKIGDFGMASLWPRPVEANKGGVGGSFEREGDKLYLAPEVLQGQYGKAADIFRQVPRSMTLASHVEPFFFANSLGMTILETATNVVVPDQ